MIGFGTVRLKRLKEGNYIMKWEEKRMMRRKKESGFTLIELMIVIAVIGILAVVLIPKVGAIKTQAKSSGVDTNVRMVQGFLQSKTSDWTSNSKNSATIAAEIAHSFNGYTEKMANPFSTGTDVYDMVNGTGSASTQNALIIRIAGQTISSHQGAIVVTLPAPSTTVLIGSSTITVDGYDNSATPVVIKSITITP